MHKRYRGYTNLGAALLICWTASACVDVVGSSPSLIKGRVLDANTNLGVENAIVALPGTTVSTRSASGGTFTLPFAGKVGTSTSVSVLAKGYAKSLHEYVVAMPAVPLIVHVAPADLATVVTTPLSNGATPVASKMSVSSKFSVGAQPFFFNLFGGVGASSAGCQLVPNAATCNYLPPPPFAGSPLPPGCCCAGQRGSGCPAGPSSGPPPPPPPPPPGAPPPQPSATSTWLSTSGDPDDAFGYYAGCLMDPDGKVAGPDPSTLQVYITAWHPGNSYLATPVALFGTQKNGQRVALESFGMTDITVWQGNELMQVVPGTSCGMRNRMAAAIQTYIANNPADMPAVWSGDPSSGIFNYKGDTTNAWTFYDNGTGDFLTSIDSLQTWNLDSGAPASNGGCVQGKVYDACTGKATLPANSPVVVWFLSKEGTRDWHGKSDASGNYCIATPLTSYWPQANETPQRVHYFVSGSKITDTNMCDPLPNGTNPPGSVDCTVCDPALESTTPEFAQCNHCALGTPPWPLPTVYNDCSPPTSQAVLLPCSFCPGSAATACTTSSGPGTPSFTDCAQLDDLTSQGPNCTCLAPKSACNFEKDECCYAGAAGSNDQNHEGCGPTGGDPKKRTCQPCTKFGAGTPCNRFVDTCCDSADPKHLLDCGDEVCVPAVDPNAQ